jgi:hypothetical protein
MSHDPENYVVRSKLQQAIWKLMEAHVLIDEIDGMGDHVNRLNQAIEDLEQELEELTSIG